MGLARFLAIFSLAATLAALGGCAGRHGAGQPPPGSRAPLGSTVPPEALLEATGAPLSKAAFDARVRTAAYILLGEEHPNPCDHLAQAEAVRRLVQAGARPAIGLEMVPANRQDVLDAFNQGKLAVADLPRALDWQAAWGYDFALYAPIFEAAREFSLPVFALNAPQGLARKVGRVGLAGLSPAERASLPGTIPPPDPRQAEALRELFEQHAKFIKKDAKPKSGRNAFADFLAVQSLWDTQMASRAVLARSLTGRPVVIIAGGGHVERGWGIARRLAFLDPKAQTVTIMPWRGGELPNPALADLFYACPVVHKTRLGMTLSQEAAPAGAPAAPLLVTDVAPGSPAAAAGMLAGDAITAAGGQPVAALFDLHKAAAEAAKAGKPLELTVTRSDETLTVAIPLQLPATPQ